MLLVNTPTHVCSKEQEALASTWTRKLMCFKQEGISASGGKHLKLVDYFTYFVSNILSTENDVNIQEGVDCCWQIIDYMEIWYESWISSKLRLYQYWSTSMNLYVSAPWGNWMQERWTIGMDTKLDSTDLMMISITDISTVE